MCPPRSKPSQKKPYFVVFGSKKYRVDPEIFCKMSNKFAELYPENPNSMKFDDIVEEEAFIAFISACQLKNYTCPPHLTDQLLDLTRAWGSPELEAHALELCRKAGKNVRPRDDPIGDLVKKLDENTETAADFKKVAAIFQDNYNDDLLQEMDAEPLFRIVCYAEKLPGFDQARYKKFVMDLFKTNPESAAVLALRLDFDLLTEKEDDEILESPEMRQQSIGFFVGHALSQVRYHAKNQINESELKLQNDIAEFNHQMEIEHGLLRRELDEYREAKATQVEEVLKRQADELEELTNTLTQTADTLVEGPLSENGIGDPALKRIKADTEDRLRMLYDHVDEGNNAKREDHHKLMQEGVDKALAEWKAEYGDPVKVKNDVEARSNEVREATKRLDETIASIDDDLDDLRGAIAAKIVRDHLRSDKGTRDISGRFKVFDTEERPIWDLTSEDVEEAEEFLKGIDARIDRMCPIRGGAKEQN